MESDLLFGFEDGDLRMLRKCGGSGKSGDAAADDEDVGGVHRLRRR